MVEKFTNKCSLNPANNGCDYAFEPAKILSETRMTSMELVNKVENIKQLLWNLISLVR